MKKSVSKKGFSFMLGLSFAMVLTACSGNSAPAADTPSGTASSGQAAGGEKKELKTVTLNIVYPGDPQPDQDRVTAELEKKLAADGIPVKLNYQYIPWGDYFQKLPIMLSTGNQVDIMWTDPALLGTFVKSNSIAPLDEVLAQHGPDIMAALDSKYWPPVTVNKKKYGVPAGAMGTTKGYYTATIRQDLREKYGLPKIQTLDDLVAFAQAVKANNPEMLVFNEPPAAFHMGEVLQSTSLDGIVFNYQTLQNN